MKLYSYIVKYDYGLAPNPFWQQLTLNVCKPQIRKTAKKGDWIIGTGSKSVQDKNGGIIDYSGALVYAMKVTSVMTMAEYDNYCVGPLRKKVPYFHKADWRIIVGDSIYDYSASNIPKLRKVIHKEKDRDTDLGGKNTLISTHFYYFGKGARKIPSQFNSIIKNEQGHLICEDVNLISEFESWLSENFELNKLYDDPQLSWKIQKEPNGSCIPECDN